MQVKENVKAPLACPPLFKEIIEHDRLWFETMKDTVVDIHATHALLRRKRELIRAADREYYPNRDDPQSAH